MEIKLQVVIDGRAFDINTAQATSISQHLDHQARADDELHKYLEQCGLLPLITDEPTDKHYIELCEAFYTKGILAGSHRYQCGLLPHHTGDHYHSEVGYW